MRPAAPEEKMAEEKKEQSDMEERALLVAVQLPNRPDVTPLLRELGDLAETAGAEVVGEMVQLRDRIDQQIIVRKDRAGGSSVELIT